MAEDIFDKVATKGDIFDQIQPLLPTPPAGIPKYIPAALQPDLPSPKIGDTLLGSQLIGVDPKTFLDRIGGGIASIVNTALPGGDARRPDKNTIPPLTPNQDIGSKLVAVGSAVPLAESAGSLLAPAIKAGARKILPSASALDEMAATNKARALAPTTLQGRADTAQIAEEMSKRGMAGGIRAKTIDKNILTEADTAGQRVKAIENRLAANPSPELQTSRQALLDEIDGAKSKLNIPRTGVTARPEAISQLDEIRSIISKLPEQIDFDQLIELRRQLDQRAAEAGAFGVNADTLKANLNRGAADMVRGKLNSLDPELKIANHDYSISRKAADLTERRQLGEVGKISSGLPGRSGILDDVLATWAGHALGGTPGGAVAEALNLGRQTRGFANLKSSFQQKLADLVRPQIPPPRGLLTAGMPQLPTPETSAVTASPAAAAPATREIRTGRLLGTGIQLPPATELPSGGSQMTVTTGRPPVRGSEELLNNGPAAKPAMGLPKGMRLSHIDMDPLTGRPKYYVYTELGSGKQLRFTSPQD